MAVAATFLKNRSALDWVKGTKLEPDAPITGAQFAEMISKAAGIRVAGLSEGSLSRVEAARVLYRESMKQYGLKGK